MAQTGASMKQWGKHGVPVTILCNEPQGLLRSLGGLCPPYEAAFSLVTRYNWDQIPLSIQYHIYP